MGAMGKRACTRGDAGADVRGDAGADVRGDAGVDGRRAGGKVLVLHGGLFSKAETSLDDLRNIGAPLPLPPPPRPVRAERQRACASVDPRRQAW